MVYKAEHHPGGRGIYAEARVLGHEFWLVVLYCPAEPYDRLEETAELVQWASNHILTRPALAIGLVEGDFNYNPWSFSTPLLLAPCWICSGYIYVLDLCVQPDTCRVRPTCGAPTW